MKRILITGANSYIGNSFEYYIKQNNVPYITETVDMENDSWRSKSFSGYDVVFHVAGIAHSDGGKISKTKANIYYAINTDLAIETAKKAKADGVKQFVFMSSAIVYGDSAPIGKQKIITKDTPVAPSNCYGDSKAQAEKGLFKIQDEDFKVVIIRSPMIYGKGCKGNYSVLSKFSKKTPVFPYIKNQRSMIYIHNLMEFIRLMIENEEKGVFWPQNGEYSNTSEIVKEIALCHNKNPLLLKGFGWAFRLLGLFVPVINKVFGNLCYDKQLSSYKTDYQIYSLRDSIQFVENNDEQ